MRLTIFLNFISKFNFFFLIFFIKKLSFIATHPQPQSGQLQLGGLDSFYIQSQIKLRNTHYKPIQPFDV